MCHSLDDHVELSAGEVINVIQGVVGDWTNYTLATHFYEDLNANVPRHILRTPTGSQGDVEVALKWVNGVYTLETKRVLDTGNADDVTFDPTTDERYLLSVILLIIKDREKNTIMTMMTMMTTMIMAGVY